MQGGEDPRYYKAVADCKHYAAYDLDHWHGEDRTAFSANVSQQELIEYFLPGFEKCIRDARAGSVMCSYNALNEIPTCADDFLIQTVARELWEYDTLPDGWVVSDCDAVANIYDPHHYRKTPQEAAAAGLKAGTDLDCGGFYRDHLPAALSENLITEADLDKSVLRLTRSLIRIGYFDDPKNQPYRQYGWEHVGTAEANMYSFRTALESLTLLKNTNNALPIDASSGISVALIGPLVNDTYFVQGNYRGQRIHRTVDPLTRPRSTLPRPRLTVVLCVCYVGQASRLMW
jgi:beta-D-xylosidase 4